MRAGISQVRYNMLCCKILFFFQPGLSSRAITVERKGIRQHFPKRKKKCVVRKLNVYLWILITINWVLTVYQDCDRWCPYVELNTQLEVVNNPNYLFGMVLTFRQVISAKLWPANSLPLRVPVQANLLWSTFQFSELPPIQLLALVDASFCGFSILFRIYLVCPRWWY